MSKELLAGVVNEQQMKIYAEETAKLQADYDNLKTKYDSLYEDYVALKRDRDDDCRDCRDCRELE